MRANDACPDLAVVFQQLLEAWLRSGKEWERERALYACTHLLKTYTERLEDAVSIDSLFPKLFGSACGFSWSLSGNQDEGSPGEPGGPAGLLCSSALTSAPICHQDSIAP